MKGGIIMTEGIIVALISLGGSALGSLFGVLASSRLTQYRLEQLEKKVSAHNNLIDRMYLREKHDEIVDEKIKVINHRIQDLEREEGHELRYPEHVA